MTTPNKRTTSRLWSDVVLYPRDSFFRNDIHFKSRNPNSNKIPAFATIPFFQACPMLFYY